MSEYDNRVICPCKEDLFMMLNHGGIRCPKCLNEFYFGNVPGEIFIRTFDKAKGYSEPKEFMVDGTLTEDE
jgi:hypothetical protein